MPALIDLKQATILLEIKRLLESGLDVNNLDEIQAALRNELKRLPRPEVKIDGSEVKIPDSVEVNNLGELQKTLSELLNVLQGKDFSPVIQAPEVNIPELKMPEINIPEIKAPEVNVKVDKSDIDISALLDALEPLKLISNKSTRPISVRMSDGQKFIKQLKKLTDETSKQMYAFSQSSGATSDDIRGIIGDPKTFNHLKVTVTTSGTPVQISATSVACSEVYLSGDTDNGTVMVVGGDNTVRGASGSKNGLVIIPGNQATTIKTNDLKNLWVDAETDGGILCVSYASR